MYEGLFHERAVLWLDICLKSVWYPWSW